MGNTLYRILVRGLTAVSHDMETVWHTEKPTDPCVFVPNHLGAWGPINMIVHFEEKDNSMAWCNAGIMVKEEIPAYVRQDHWWNPESKLAGFYDKTLPRLASWILPSILNAAPTVPVYHDARIMQTMRQSLKLLQEGKNLVIFPEQPSGHKSHHMWINLGFLQIAPLYFRRYGKELNFYPVHIDKEKHTFEIAEPIRYDSTRPLEEQKADFARVLSNGLRGWPADTPLEDLEAEVPTV